ncbi:MAG TPA: 2,3-bisphosphoglycerate-independent phosphoglycerate mutase [Candidatus Dormibacteraeota bacterium]|nr:2,3-bisphosphoglycerate-independent phosphoglycerate mutase [Candidatus Dormibacteraeota bacterium]
MSHPKVHPAILCVCDGWGCGEESPGNAIALARTPNFDQLMARWPHTTLAASGLAVGLPEGQQGNSEVGHLTIGSGRVVLQDLTRIDQAITDGSFFSNHNLTEAVGLAKSRGTWLHLLGLVSDGGVHSHQRHVVALCELSRRMELDRVAIHAFTDGRDTSPRSGRAALALLLEELEGVGVGRLTSVSGRYFAMDRDRHWDRTARALRAILGQGPSQASSALEYLAAQYSDGVGDEFIPPASLIGTDGDVLGIAEGDVVIHFNFRADRGRQLCHALVDRELTDFDRGSVPQIARLCTFTQVDKTLEAIVAFPRPLVPNTLAEVVERAGLTQFHVAETEKYAHVTYFLNGGREEPFSSEERSLVPSQRVATYDQAPEMSANGITELVLDRLRRARDTLIAVNYANADMVGHTGELAATIAAVEYLDRCLGQVADAAAAAGYLLVVTADHGNAEMKVDLRDGSKLTAHTTSRVPMILADGDRGGALAEDGGLRDVAPTLLSAMGLDVPAEMTGSDLRQAESE